MRDLLQRDREKAMLWIWRAEGTAGAPPQRPRRRRVETVPERMKQTEARNGRKKIAQGKRRENERRPGLTK